MKPSRQTKLQQTHQFAGFTWPRYLAELPRGTLQQRRDRYKFTGGVYVLGELVTRATKGAACYLEAQNASMWRWRWCDDVAKHLRHTGWFVDDDQGEIIRGVVVSLSHGRFLAGWSMGEGCAAWIERAVYDDETTAAYSADEWARLAAEAEREYNENCRAEARRPLIGDGYPLTAADLCVKCEHCIYRPGELSRCKSDDSDRWPGDFDEAGRVYDCLEFIAHGRETADDGRATIHAASREAAEVIRAALRWLDAGLSVDVEADQHGARVIVEDPDNLSIEGGIYKTSTAENGELQIFRQTEGPSRDQYSI